MLLRALLLVLHLVFVRAGSTEAYVTGQFTLVEFWREDQKMRDGLRIRFANFTVPRCPGMEEGWGHHNCHQVLAIMDKLPYPSPWEAERFVSRAVDLNWNDQRTRDEFGDMAELYYMEYANFGRFFVWSEVPPILYQLREGDDLPFTWWERWRAVKKFETVFRHDITYTNLGDVGERTRFVIKKWEFNTGQLPSVESLPRYVEEMGSLYHHLQIRALNLTKGSVSKGVLHAKVSESMDMVSRFSSDYKYVIAPLHMTGADLDGTHDMNANVRANVDAVLAAALTDVVDFVLMKTSTMVSHDDLIYRPEMSNSDIYRHSKMYREWFASFRQKMCTNSYPQLASNYACRPRAPAVSLNGSSLVDFYERSLLAMFTQYNLPSYESEVISIAQHMIKQGLPLGTMKIFLEDVKALYSDIVYVELSDGNRTWHSDKRRSPVFSFDIRKRVTMTDIAVFLDEALFIGGFCNFQSAYGYTESDMEVLGAKVAASYKDKTENYLRKTVSPLIWLNMSSPFEKWRWSWALDTHGGGKASTSEWVFSTIPETHKHYYVFYRDVLGVSGSRGNLLLALYSSCMCTCIFAAVSFMRFAITKPWQKPAPIPRTEAEHAYTRLYEAREFKIVWFRVYPVETFIFFGTSFMTNIAMLVFDWSNDAEVLPLVLYAIIYYWLTYIMIDVYVVKFTAHALTVLLPGMMRVVVKPPISPQEIRSENSMMVMVPLRPADIGQLSKVIEKQAATLAAVPSDNFIFVLCLQAKGNSTDLFRHYELMLRAELYNNPDMPAHVKNRFIVCQMREIAKPHNMHKWMRWLHMATEHEDEVTPDWIWGIRTEDAMPRSEDYVIRRSPANSVYIGEPLAFLGGDSTSNPGKGADAGILCTPEGMDNLRRLRNEGNPGYPLLENVLILDSDNYVSAVTLLRMTHTMNDDYLIWQPRVKFDNLYDSMFAYTKDFANESLGNVANNGTLQVYGGIRTFGKYFCRHKNYYYEEVSGETASQCNSDLTCMWDFSQYFLCAWAIMMVMPEPPWWAHGLPLLLCLTLLWASLTQVKSGLSRVAQRFANQFGLHRTFILSEDARHGSYFGRCSYLFDQNVFINESTPASFYDEVSREEDKWMTFDMRDSYLLNTPMVMVMGHLEVWLAIMFTFNVGAWGLVIYSFYTSCTLYQLGLFWALAINAFAGFWMVFFMWQVALPEKVERVLDARFPFQPLRGWYCQNLVVRGLLSEPIWGIMLVMTFTASLQPGAFQLSYPLMAEVLFATTMGLLLHVKFTGSLLSRIDYFLNPGYDGEWKKGARRVYSVYMVSRLSNFIGIFYWFIHDIAMAVCEVSISSSVYLTKLTSKPGALFWSAFECYLDLRNLLRGIPTRLTWKSFIESDCTIPFELHIFRFRNSIALGMLTMMLVLCGRQYKSKKSVLPIVSIVFSWNWLMVIGVAGGVVFGLVPVLNIVMDIKQWFRRGAVLGLAYMTWRSLVEITCDAMMGFSLFYAGYYSESLAGFFPMALFIRASSIFIGAFFFGPAVAWISNIMPTTEFGRNVVFWVSVVTGWLLILLVTLIVMYVHEFMPLLPSVGTWIPTNDGTALAIVPIPTWLIEQNGGTWYFAMMYVLLVYGSLIIGTLGYIFGILDLLTRGLDSLLKEALGWCKSTWNAVPLEEDGDEDDEEPAVKAAWTPAQANAARDGMERDPLIEAFRNLPPAMPFGASTLPGQPGSLGSPGSPTPPSSEDGGKSPVSAAFAGGQLAVVDDGEEDEAGEEVDMCKICFENKCDSVILWCGHVCVCMKCARLLKECPFCRQPVAQVVKIYKT